MVRGAIQISRNDILDKQWKRVESINPVLPHQALAAATASWPWSISPITQFIVEHHYYWNNYRSCFLQHRPYLLNLMTGMSRLIVDSGFYLKENI